ncbi:bis(5'-nucleosyl)-tetraphosphatase (symmetrical), partial [Tremellales sp. Uapishka_1]
MSQPNSPPPRYDDPDRPLSPHSPPQSYSQPIPEPEPPRRPHLRSKRSIMDEILPIPTSYSTPTEPSMTFASSLRRSGSLAVLLIFFVTIIFMVSTDETESTVGGLGLKSIFGVGSSAGEGGAGWVGMELEKPQEEVDDTVGNPLSKPDFEKYIMLHTLPDKAVDLTTPGKRIVFIGDVHGSLDPLHRLMDKISFDEAQHRIIHVGDLIAKGEKNNEVLSWMRQRRVSGVRGNHDQPVLQWRAWMEWAGGDDYLAFVDSIGAGGGKSVATALNKANKMYPTDWEWGGQHWQIAKLISRSNYLYLSQLPLTLHIPSLHTIVVHAGLLPVDPLKPSLALSQPLVAAAAVNSSAASYDSSSARRTEELSILFDIPQNQEPWNLINMRSVYEKGKKKGTVTKASDVGTPWSEIWAREMKRCAGAGAWGDTENDETAVEGVQVDDAALDKIEESDEMVQRDKRKKSKAGKQIDCSPLTVIYGHAAGRGLDIKPFSKGIDTGCVYGRQLTALVLGDTKGLQGQTVRVGDHHGVLVSVECEKGGL